MNNVTRFELIDNTGRRIVYYGNASYSLQDLGRTLKVFTERKIEVYDEEFPGELLEELRNGKSVIDVFCRYRGIAQEKLCELAEVNRGFLKDIEHGRCYGKFKYLKRVAQVLRIDLNTLLQ